MIAPLACVSHRPGTKQHRANGRRFPLCVGPEFSFWIAVSVVLSVVLTILLNLPFLF